MKKSLFVVVAITSALAGCASTNTGIVQISEDTYMYAKQDWMAYSGSVVKAELYKEANAFCAGKGKKFAPLNSTKGVSEFLCVRRDCLPEVWANGFHLS
ncbi:hypothetical protein [Polaromonas sp. AET17H-212]|uniref:hypothetical protein n=1 Tax=Polaromonas sp. AET17H-212 TaxID=1977061 RepID=UPI0011417A58|nr:hypothetical protein [Polaromonas sp. AET17H-212]